MLDSKGRKVRVRPLNRLIDGMTSSRLSRKFNERMRGPMPINVNKNRNYRNPARWRNDLAQLHHSRATSVAALTNAARPRLLASPV
jgi:hypothetical protein